MQGEMEEGLSLPLASATRALLGSMCARLDTVSRALKEHYGIAPSAERIEGLEESIVELRNLLELSDAVSEESASGSAGLGRPEAHRQDQSWRGQESGRSDHVPGCVGYNPRYALLAKAKAEAKAAFRKGRRSRPRRRKGRR